MLAILFILIPSLISASEDVQSLVPSTSQTDNARRRELANQLSYMCNPFCMPKTSIDCQPCFLQRPASCCRTIPRSQYYKAAEELFDRTGRLENNCGKKCCIATQRCGCNGCTVASYCAPCATLATCTTCAATVAACTVDPKSMCCDDACADPALHEYIGQNIVFPSLLALQITLGATVFSWAVGKACMYTLSDSEGLCGAEDESVRRTTQLTDAVPEEIPQ